MFEQITVNLLAGRVQRRQLNGRSYLVAPISLIVPGVLNGSRGPLYYPADEVKKNPTMWDGVPIVVYHPTRNGRPVSASDSSIPKIGFLKNPKVGNKLVAEGWFDIELTKKTDNRVLQALQSKQPMEISTGLFTENEPAAPGSNFSGKSFQYVARNYQPDHLAVLPDQIGACSIRDGCGLNVNQRNKTSTTNRRSTMDREQAIEALVNNCDCFDEDDRDTLNFLSDEKLTKLVTDLRCGESTPVVKTPARNRQEPSPTSNDCGKPHKGRTVNEMDDEELEEEMTKRKAKKMMQENRQPQTIDEWLATAPPEVQQTLRYATELELNQKKELVKKLTANLAGDQHRKMTENLLKKSVEELTDLVTLIPEPAKAPPRTPMFSGAAAPASVSNRLTEEDAKDYLPLPTLNFEDEVKQRQKVS